MTTAAEIRAHLHRRRGEWPTLCERTGLSYWWLTKFAQGRIREPGHGKVQRLLAYFEAHPLAPERPAQEGPPADDTREVA